MRVAIIAKEENHSFNLIEQANGRLVQKIVPFQTFFVENSRFGYLGVPVFDEKGYSIHIYIVEEPELSLELAEVLELLKHRRSVCYIKQNTKGLWALTLPSAKQGILHIHKPTNDPLINKMRDKMIKTNIISPAPLPMYKSGASSPHISLENQWDYTLDTDGEIFLAQEGEKVSDSHPNAEHRGQLKAPNYVRIVGATYIIGRNRKFPYFIWFASDEAKQKVVELI